MLDLIGFLNLLMINKKLKSINPKNNLIINSWDIFSQSKIDLIIENASNAQLEWESENINLRIELIKEFYYILKNKNKELSILMADEMGKPVSQGKLEIDKCLCNPVLPPEGELIGQIKPYCVELIKRGPLIFAPSAEICKLVLRNWQRDEKKDNLSRS